MSSMDTSMDSIFVQELAKLYQLCHLYFDSSLLSVRGIKTWKNVKNKKLRIELKRGDLSII